MIPAAEIDAAAEWAADEYRRRTQQIADGFTVDPYWLDNESRVSWHETLAACPALRADPVDARIRFQPAFNAAMRRRRLLGVLRGTRSIDEWAAWERAHGCERCERCDAPRARACWPDGFSNPIALCKECRSST